MNEELKKLYDERLKIDADQRAIVDKAKAENRGFTADETQTYEKMDARFNELTDLIKAKEAEIKQIGDLAQKHEGRQDLFKQNANDPIKPDPVKPGKTEKRVQNLVATPEYAKAFRDFLYDGHRALEMHEELRALQSDKDTIGGFLVAPEDFVLNLIKAKDRMVFVRQFATVYSVPNAASLGAPVLDADPADPTWTAKLLARCSEMFNVNLVNSGEALCG